MLKEGMFSTLSWRGPRPSISLLALRSSKGFVVVETTWERHSRNARAKRNETEDFRQVYNGQKFVSY
jgi:hypothetical protein